MLFLYMSDFLLSYNLLTGRDCVFHIFIHSEVSADTGAYTLVPLKSFSSVHALVIYIRVTSSPA